MIDSDQTWLNKTCLRIVNCTPRKLRPLLVVAVLVGGMLATQAALVAMHHLQGEHRSINYGFIAYLGACMSAAALTYGVLGALPSEMPRVGGWLLGLAMSVSFWLTAVLTGPTTGIQTAGDLVALGILIFGSGIFVGWIMWRSRKDQSI